MLRWLIVPVIALGVSCSSPLHETSEPGQPAEQAAAAEQPVTEQQPPSAPPAPKVVDAPVFVTPEPPAKPVAASARPVETAASSHAPAPADPVKAVLAEEARRVEGEQTIVRLAAERDAAAAVVQRREKDLLAFKNPFLPRPQLAADEAAEIKGLGGAARARWAEREVAEAKAKLDEAQKAYDDAKASR